MAAPGERSVKARCSDVSNIERGIEESSEIGRDSSQLNVDPLTLPSLLLSDRKSLPKKVSAIYFAISPRNEVVYIGRAVCLHRRWAGQKHHKRVQLEELGGVRIAWMQVSDPALLPDIESGLINHFDPPLNLINSGFVSRRRLKARESKPRESKARRNEIKVRLNDQELKILRAEAQRRDVSVSEVIRDYLKTLNKEPQAS